MKLIKLFENFNSIEQDIKDIFWEMAYENGFHVKVMEIPKDYSNKLIITLGDQEYDLDILCIDTNKCFDDFLTLKSYIESNGYKFNGFSYDDRGEIINPGRLYGLEGDELFGYLFQIPLTSYIRIYFNEKNPL